MIFSIPTSSHELNFVSSTVATGIVAITHFVFVVVVEELSLQVMRSH